MLQRLVILAALGGAACTGGSGGSGGVTDGQADGATGFNGQPCSQYHLCVQDGGVFNCDCGGSASPVCPASAQPEQPCESSASSCMTCSQGAGASCYCEDAGLVPHQDAALWECIGTGSACR